MGRRYLVFLCAQASLYSAFLTLDLLQVGSGWSTALKYGSILLCFLLSCGGGQDPDRRLVRAALGVTLLADLFLLVLGRWYLAGVGAFCVVQALYFVRLRRPAGRAGLAPSVAAAGPERGSAAGGGALQCPGAFDRIERLLFHTAGRQCA